MRGGGCRPHPDGGAAEVARGRPRPGGCTPRRGCSGCGTPRVMSSGRGEGERGNRPRASVGNNSGAGGKHSGRLTKPDGRRSGLPGNTNCKKGGRRPERHCEKKVTKREAGKGHTAGRVAEHQDRRRLRSNRQRQQVRKARLRSLMLCTLQSRGDVGKINVVFNHLFHGFTVACPHFVLRTSCTVALCSG